MVLEEPGESDLFGKLKQHQLQQKDGGDLCQRSRPATGGRGERSWAVDGTVADACRILANSSVELAARRRRTHSLPPSIADELDHGR